MLHFSRGKTENQHKWAILLFGFQVGQVEAVYRSKTKRTWNGSVTLPLRDGSERTESLEGVFSAKQLFQQLNAKLGNVTPNDINMDVLQATGKSVAPAPKAKAPKAAAPAAAPAASSTVNTTDRWLVSDGNVTQGAESRAKGRALAKTLGEGFVARQNPNYVEA